MTRQNDPIDRQIFLAECERLARQVAALEARLSDVTLTADELARLPAQIAEAAGSLGAIESRIARFAIEDCAAEIAAFEAEIATLERQVHDLTPLGSRFGEWQAAHARLMAAAEPPDDAVQEVVDLYAAVLPAARALLTAFSKYNLTLLYLLNARDRQRDLLAKETREAKRKTLKVLGNL